ncbi:MAG: MarR family transcriptional regulator [Candidatus Marinimicrobia bacterium]|nr:MarR family transcriptional regulator [Candidatus Neomarinimicrobiota bacterium]
MVTKSKSQSKGDSLPYDLQILQALRQIIRSIDIHSRKLKATHNTTAPQLICLGIIVNSGSSTVTKIAKQAYLSPSTVVGILDRLEHEGYIVRERDVNDRRNWNAIATIDGKALLKKVPSPLQEDLLKALQELPDHEQANITASLLKIVNLMGADSIEAAPILETAEIISGKK